MKNRNLEMVYFLQDMCQKVNFIYLLTHAGIPSSPAACRTRFLPAADQPGEQCGGRGADEKRHCPARLRAEEQKPDYGTDDGIASTGGERAQELLRRTDLSVGEIACRVGYTTPGYFGRLYKKYLGITPEQERMSK